MQYILTDIEGTTTSISFVHEVLFPYSEKRISHYVSENRGKEYIKDYLQEENINEQEFIQRLLHWIKEDRKEKVLKEIQGKIWKEGYERGELKGHVYPDVLPCLEKWQQMGLKMAVYSSGSIEAQKLIFGHSEAGDLTKYFSFYFDTSIGHKREENSYRNILQVLKAPANQVLFLSDIAEELDAAQAVGIKTIQLLRSQNMKISKHKNVTNFFEIEMEQL
jgi:enolase-phosphatase E1